MPNMNAQSLAVRKLWAMFKSRSKVTVKSHVKIYDTIGKVLSEGTHLPNMKALSLRIKMLRLMIKFVRSRSKVTVKVTCSKFMYHRKGLVIRNADAKYESPIC